MFGEYFYNSTIKKSVAVFGTIFNNITVRRIGDDVTSSITRVPLAYAPRAKFLERITAEPDFEAPNIALKLPRMSFEITAIAVDTSSTLNPLNKLIAPGSAPDATNSSVSRQSVPYILSFQLSVYGKNQDDVLQIVEQILPTFMPEYNLVVKDLVAPGISGNVPIILTAVSPSDDFEGSFEARRVIIYTLEFDMKVRFYGGSRTEGVIHDMNINYFDMDKRDEPLETTRYFVDSQDTPTDYTLTSMVNDVVTSVKIVTPPST